MRIKDEIYNFLVKRGTDGATDEQIQTSLKISPDSERPARVQLVKDKWVVDSGLKRSVPNSNRRAIVWVAIRGRDHSIIDSGSNKCQICGGSGFYVFEEETIPCFNCDPENYINWLGIGD